MPFKTNHLLLITISLSIFTIFACGGDSPTEDINPNPQGRAGIVYVSNYGDNGAYEIMIMDTDGLYQTRLTEIAGIDNCPAVSPDGSKILFVSERDGNREIYLMNIDGTEQVNLTNNPADDDHPAWHPDGNLILFSSDRPNDNNYDIFRMNIDGTNVVNITDFHRDDTYPCYSPDGSGIVYISSRSGDGDDELYIMNADGTNAHRIYENLWDDEAPKWSPTGDRIVFTILSNPSQIAAINSDGTNYEEFTGNYNDNWPSWSPDGSQIVFERQIPGNPELSGFYIMNSDGTGPEKIPETSIYDHEPFWSPFE
jgi:TolB protein